MVNIDLEVSFVKALREGKTEEGAKRGNKGEGNTEGLGGSSRVRVPP